MLTMRRACKTAIAAMPAPADMLMFCRRLCAPLCCRHARSLCCWRHIIHVAACARCAIERYVPWRKTRRQRVYDTYAAYACDDMLFTLLDTPCQSAQFYYYYAYCFAIDAFAFIILRFTPFRFRHYFRAQSPLFDFRFRHYCHTLPLLMLCHRC